MASVLTRAAPTKPARASASRPARRMGPLAAGVLLGAALAHLGYVNLRDPFGPGERAGAPRFPHAWSYLIAMNEHPAQGILLTYRDGIAPRLTEKFELQDVTLPAAAPHGNAVLRFVNIEPERGAQAILEIYQRAAYTLYPRRLYVCEPNSLFNSGLDLPAKGFLPDGDWLRRHEVAAIVTATADAAGRITWTVQPVHYVVPEP